MIRIIILHNTNSCHKRVSNSKIKVILEGEGQKLKCKCLPLKSVAEKLKKFIWKLIIIFIT